MSLYVSLNEMEREIVKALLICFKLNDCKSEIVAKEAYTCLKMLDRMLPNDLDKMMRLVTLKYICAKNFKEIAAIKCVIDFRISYF